MHEITVMSKAQEPSVYKIRNDEWLFRCTTTT